MTDATLPDPTAARRRGTVAIAAIVVVGVLLRLLTVRSPGFPSDVSTFMAWAEKLASVGPARFYEPGYFSDYPPGFLYVLWLLGRLFDGDVLRLAVKAIGIPADVGIALLLAAVVRRHAGNAAAALAAAVWMFQPAPIFAGPYWGQVDAVGTLPYLAALVAAGSRRWAVAGLLAGLATMTKPQFGLVLGVVVVAVAFEFIRNGDWKPAAKAVGAAAATMVALAIPFGMTLQSFVALVRSASETYPYSSLYAFNGWSVLLDFWKPDDAWFVAGAILLAAGLVASVIPLWWRRDTAALLAVGAAAAMAFYFLPTRAHERYLFPAIALLVPFAVARRRILVPYLVLAGAFFVSLYFAFTRYPQNDLAAPAWLDATVFGRSGQIVLALVMLGTAALVCWWLARGEARLEPTLDLAPARPAPPERAREARPWALPAGFAIGRPAVRRDVLFAITVAVLVLLTRGYRLDWPRDMYFDEVYHARTAMELLAEREPYEWTHPHLAKEVMAVALMAFGGDRVTGTERAPTDVTAFTVTNDGSRVFGTADGTISIHGRDGQGDRTIARVGSTPRSIAVDGDHVFVVADRELADLSLTRQHPDATRPLAAPPTAASFAGGRIVVGSSSTTSIYAAVDADPRVVTVAAVAITAKPDGSELYVLDPNGAVHVLDAAAGTETKTYPGVAPERAIAYSQGPNTLVLARSEEPVLDSIALEDGHRDTVKLANARTGGFAAGASVLADVPRTDFVYALADGRAVVVDVHGLSPFAAIPTRGAMLGVDGTGDALLSLAADGSVDRVDTGRHALAWRLPGVVAAALEAFFLVLLAGRLFRSRLIPLLVGIAVLADGSMFAQARIGMNDPYVGLFIVAGWYFVVAAHRPRRSATLDLLIAGLLFGLGAASKWAAFYTLAGVFVVAVVETLGLELGILWLGGLLIIVFLYALGLSSIPVLAGLLLLDFVVLVVLGISHRLSDPGGHRDGPLDLLRHRGLNAAVLFLAFAIVPVAVYLDSYVRWFGGPTMPYGWDIKELTQQMYWYHSSLTSPHPAASPWWSWPIVLKPVYWYYGQADGGANAYIYDAGNIVLFWGALVATVWCAVAAIRARSVALGFVVFALLVQYVAWIPISRVLFFYHFYTALPFYLLALAAWLAYLWDTAKRGLVVAYLATAVAAFAYFYPFVSGQPVPGDVASIYFILPTWQYDCQFYPSFTCPVGLPSGAPIVAFLARVGGALALGAVAAAGALALAFPARARAIARVALGRGALGGHDRE